jgi:hypothetical protein
VSDEQGELQVLLETEDDLIDDEVEQQSALVSRMEVRGLFGRYNYDIEVPPEAGTERLLLFYADNGRGKTTVLAFCGISCRRLSTGTTGQILPRSCSEVSGRNFRTGPRFYSRDRLRAMVNTHCG